MTVSTATPAPAAAAFTSAAFSRLRTEPTAWKPLRAASSTVARPIPELAPVTSTVRSALDVMAVVYPAPVGCCRGGAHGRLRVVVGGGGRGGPPPGTGGQRAASGGGRRGDSGRGFHRPVDSNPPPGAPAGAGRVRGGATLLRLRGQRAQRGHRRTGVGQVPRHGQPVRHGGRPPPRARHPRRGGRGAAVLLGPRHRSRPAPRRPPVDGVQPQPAGGVGQGGLRPGSGGGTAAAAGGRRHGPPAERLPHGAGGRGGGRGRLPPAGQAGS